MERKLVKHGPATLMVSVPKPWANSHNLEKGGVLHCTQTEEELIFTAKEKKIITKEITIDFTGLDRSSIMFFLRALYRKGYSTITITFKNPVAMHHRGKKEERISSIVLEEVRRLIGIEIAMHKKSSITLKQLAEPTTEEFYPSMNRVFLLYKGALEGVVDAIQTQDNVLLQSVEETHDAITKLVSFCLRMLGQQTKGGDVSHVSHILMLYDIMIDILKYFSRNTIQEDRRFDKKDHDILKKIVQLHEIVHSLLFKWNNEKASRVQQLRNHIKSTKNPTVEYLLPLIEIQRDIIETRLTMDGALDDIAR